MMITLLLSLALMAALFLLLFAAVALVQDKRKEHLLHVALFVPACLLLAWLSTVAF